MSREFFLKKYQSQFKPFDERGIKVVKRLRDGDIIRCEFWKQRNVRFHRKFFALLKIAFENQDKYDVFEAFRAEVIMRAGYFNTHIHLSGQESFSPKSISFKNMDQMEFEKLYSAVIDVILKFFLVGMSEEELRRATEGIIGFV